MERSLQTLAGTDSLERVSSLDTKTIIIIFHLCHFSVLTWCEIFSKTVGVLTLLGLKQRHICVCDGHKQGSRRPTQIITLLSFGPSAPPISGEGHTVVVGRPEDTLLPPVCLCAPLHPFAKILFVCLEWFGG